MKRTTFKSHLFQPKRLRSTHCITVLRYVFVQHCQWLKYPHLFTNFAQLWNRRKKSGENFPSHFMWKMRFITPNKHYSFYLMVNVIARYSRRLFSCVDWFFIMASAEQPLLSRFARSCSCYLLKLRGLHFASTILLRPLNTYVAITIAIWSNLYMKWPHNAILKDQTRKQIMQQNNKCSNTSEQWRSIPRHSFQIKSTNNLWVMSALATRYHFMCRVEFKNDINVIWLWL